MCPSRGPSLLLVAFVAVLGSSSPARAWTRTVVQSARAIVDIDRDASMRVALRLNVQVHAGWLHQLELEGLGSGVELDKARPPYLRSEEGEIYRPDVEVSDDGRIRLSFVRKEAPRQGEYRVLLRYRSQADIKPLDVPGAPTARIAWTLPAWETGLHNVSVEIRTPSDASVVTELHEAPPGVDFEVTRHKNGTRIEWRRIHLPRMTGWTLRIDVPLAAFALPGTPTSMPDPIGFRPLSIPEKRPIPWALFLLAALVLLKRVLHRPTRPKQPSLQDTWQPVPPKALPGPAVFVGDLLDATTGPGLATLLIGSACLVALGQPAAALFLLPIFFTGTRQHTLPSSAEAHVRLRGFMSALRLPLNAPEMCFRWEISPERAVRMRIHLATQRAGLLSLSFVVTGWRSGFVLRRSIMLLVETRTQSDADDLVRRRAADQPEVRSPDGRIARLIEWKPETVGLLRALSDRNPARPAKASRGTWLLREIAEKPRKAA